MGLGDTSKAIGKAVMSIARGEFLFTLKCDKFFPHIIYFFFLICIVLGLNMMIEKAMVKVEQNRTELYDMKIFLTHKNAELVSLGKLSKVEEMLDAAGSDLTIPEGPAIILKK